MERQYNQRIDYRNERRSRSCSRSRSRSRSPSPPASRSIVSVSGRRRDADRPAQQDDLEQQRKSRMARLRAENEAEEKKMAALDNAAKRREDGLDFQPEIRGSLAAAKEIPREALDRMDEEEQMQALLGFGNFDSTKGKVVDDNATSASKGTAAKNKARKYRQYMNRSGGFNRPLDKMN